MEITRTREAEIYAVLRIVTGFLFGVMALVSSKMLTRKFEWGPEERYN